MSMDKIILKFTLSAVACLFSLQAWTKPGFHPVDDLQVPAPVQESSQAVFKLRAPTLQFVPDSPTGQSILGYYKRLLATLDSDEKELLEPQIQTCQQYPQQNCVIYGQGTAFLAGESDSLWTTLHSIDMFALFMGQQLGIYFEDGLSQEEFVTLQTIHFPLRLLNQQGREIFGGPEDFATIAHLDESFFNGKPLSSDENASDYVILKLSRPLKKIEPLRFKDSSPTAGTLTYLLGYPKSTADRTTYGVPDSDGKSLRVSIGPILELREALQRQGRGAEGSRPQSAQPGIYVDGDCLSGNSGGPLLNSSGEVLGLYHSSAPAGVSEYSKQQLCLALTIP